MFVYNIKFVLDAKVHNDASWKMSHLRLYGTTLVLNMTLKSKWVFWNSKIYQKCKFHGVWTKLEMKICFLGQPWTKYCRQNHKIK